MTKKMVTVTVFDVDLDEMLGTRDHVIKYINDKFDEAEMLHGFVDCYLDSDFYEDDNNLCMKGMRLENDSEYDVRLKYEAKVAEIAKKKKAAAEKKASKEEAELKEYLRLKKKFDVAKTKFELGDKVKSTAVCGYVPEGDIALGEEGTIVGVHADARFPYSVIFTTRSCPILCKEDEVEYA